ncbi:hypothetical protein CFBP3846_P300120 (plasmid) [Pseudomonas syringae pv. avii]|uniref:Uncharacterized protein n=2 Tax=Pseudomonas syringae group TaxID=136849 RepID=A0ABY1UFS9_PSESX|nr:hypothetical protein CFBP3846_P300120 [Pseudomonas syringae pv. avii]SPD89702.1 hypothetical protein PSCFBP3800_P200066 [Pseudomonas syringae group genomosp. 3]
MNSCVIGTLPSTRPLFLKNTAAFTCVGTWSFTISHKDFLYDDNAQTRENERSNPHDVQITLVSLVYQSSGSRLSGRTGVGLGKLDPFTAG